MEYIAEREFKSNGQTAFSRFLDKQNYPYLVLRSKELGLCGPCRTKIIMSVRCDNA